MKKNLKVNLIWFGLIIGLFLILKGLELSGIMNLYYIQILMGIGISILMGLGTNLVLGFSGQFTLGQSRFHGNRCVLISYHHWHDANL